MAGTGQAGTKSSTGLQKHASTTVAAFGPKLERCSLVEFINQPCHGSRFHVTMSRICNSQKDATAEGLLIKETKGGGTYLRECCHIPVFPHLWQRSNSTTQKMCPFAIYACSADYFPHRSRSNARHSTPPLGRPHSSNKVFSTHPQNVQFVGGISLNTQQGMGAVSSSATNIASANRLHAAAT